MGQRRWLEGGDEDGGLEGARGDGEEGARGGPARRRGRRGRARGGDGAVRQPGGVEVVVGAVGGEEEIEGN